MPILAHSTLATILLGTFCAINLTAAIAANDVATLSKANGSAPTCPSNSINYITQTLPQQCLATTWIKPQTPADASTLSDSLDGNVTTSQSTSLVQPTYSSSLNHAAISTSSPYPEIVQASAVPAAQTDVLAQPVPDSEQESDADPFSDKGNFLSFEEWKKQMLQKAGQSPDNIGSERTGVQAGLSRRRPGDINNALDTLGDDSEIELDFRGFVNTDNPPRPLNVNKKQDFETRGQDEDGAKSNKRLGRKSKDAGTTCKERFNYASFDCAATVLKTNSETKGSTSVLVENKDSYMLNPCKVKNKFFIVELCNDILIDTVVLANFEFFSSTFRTFRVSVADRYPVKTEKWRELGTFEARNTREIQPFLIENGLIFARYLRFEFLTHYGVEYYCPVSLLRVHGKTMMDDFNDFRSNRGDEDAVEDAAGLENEESSEESQKAEVAQEPEEAVEYKIDNQESSILHSQEALPTATLDAQVNTSSALDNTTGSSLLSNRKDLSIWVSYASPLFESHDIVTRSCNSNATLCHLENSDAVKSNIASPTMSNETVSTISHPSTMSITSEPGEPTTLPSQPSMTVPTNSLTPSKPEQIVSNQNSTQSSQQARATTVRSPLSSKPILSSIPHSTKVTPTTPPAATPSTQESFFKSIAKRLQHLEQNSTLSLQYIEEQSRLLREAFTKVEKRQLSKTSNFLENLNTTVLSELRDFRILYDQMWQSTVLELSSQRQATQQEIVALSARLSILADETVFQKRMLVVQFFLILICLALPVFSRMSSNPGGPTYVDLQSVVRDTVSKPSVNLSKYLNLESPPGSPGARSVSRYGFFSGRTLSPGAEEEHTRSASSGSTAIDDGIKTNGTAGTISPASPVAESLSSMDEEDESGVEPAGKKEEGPSPEAQQASLLRSWSSPEMGSQFQAASTEDEATEYVDAECDQIEAKDTHAAAPETEGLADPTTSLLQPELLV